jgi:hypothetical protein
MRGVVHTVVRVCARPTPQSMNLFPCPSFTAIGDVSSSSSGQLLFGDESDYHRILLAALPVLTT